MAADLKLVYAKLRFVSEAVALFMRLKSPIFTAARR
jgi:hypothetical protein